MFGRKPLQATYRLMRRAAHTMPDIKLAKGQSIPGLFTSQGLQIAWFDYQHHLITQLNQAVEKLPELGEIKSLAGLTTACIQSDNPELRAVAAIAAQAYTNEFFFKSINPEGSKNPDVTNDPSSLMNASSFRNAPASNAVQLFGTNWNLPKMPENAENLTEEDFARVQSADFHTFSFLTRSSGFGKFSNFKELMISRGDAQFGNGAVWLVKHGDQGSLLNTYGWGNPLTNQATASSGESEFDSLISTSSSISVTPVLAINLWEHIYLHDYGVAGKRRFLENVFDCLDWGVIDDRLAPM